MDASKETLSAILRKMEEDLPGKLGGQRLELQRLTPASYRASISGQSVVFSEMSKIIRNKISNNISFMYHIYMNIMIFVKK